MPTLSLNSARLAATLLTLAGGSAMAGPANLIQNPGFESGDFSSWSSFGFAINNAGRYVHSGSFSAYTRCVGHGCVPTPGQGAFIAQTLNTRAGEQYDLSFWVGEDAQPTSEFTVFWDGRPIADVLNPANNTLPSPPGAGFVEFTYADLTASSAATVLEVHGRQDPSSIYFDDFLVTPVSTSVAEPTALGLLGIGAVSLAAARRRTTPRQA